MTELLTVKETAAYLRTSLQQVRRMIREGDLFAVKVGREYRIPCPPWWSSWTDIVIPPRENRTTYCTDAARLCESEGIYKRGDRKITFRCS